MDTREIEQTVLAVLATVLKRPFVIGQEITRQNTPGWDSLKHIEIMFALEDEFGVEFSEEELAGLDSVSKIAEEVAAKNAS